MTVDGLQLGDLRKNNFIIEEPAGLQYLLNRRIFRLLHVTSPLIFGVPVDTQRSLDSDGPTIPSQTYPSSACKSP